MEGVNVDNGSETCVSHFYGTRFTPVPPKDHPPTDDVIEMVSAPANVLPMLKTVGTGSFILLLQEHCLGETSPVSTAASRASAF